MTEPLVTVVMTTYNGEEFVAKTIQSILDQEFSDFELIIIDDASSDRTVDIIGQFDDPRIRLFPNDKNLGISVSRNQGLSLARGKYVAPHDHDDISYPHRLAKEVQAWKRIHHWFSWLIALIFRRVPGPRKPNHRYPFPIPQNSAGHCS